MVMAHNYFHNLETILMIILAVMVVERRHMVVESFDVVNLVVVHTAVMVTMTQQYLYKMKSNNLFLMIYHLNINYLKELLVENSHQLCHYYCIHFHYYYHCIHHQQQKHLRFRYYIPRSYKETVMVES